MSKIRQAPAISIYSLVLLALLASAQGVVSAENDSPELPENARAKSYGSGWECERGYREANGACAAIGVPANAYLTNTSYGSGWECGRGYREDNGACAAVRVPANAYPTNTRSGNGWKCERGYRKVKGACPSIKVPPNAYLNNSGDRWKCNRGYRAVDESCVAIKVQANGYLTDSSHRSSWSCDHGFERSMKPALPSMCRRTDT